MMYLDFLGNIPGESASPYGDWNEKVEIQHMAYSIHVSTSMEAGTGLASGGATVSALQVTKVMDKSTPLLFYHLCAGIPIDKMMIRGARQGSMGAAMAGHYEAETYTFEKVVVAGYQISGNVGMGGLPTEAWTFSFSKVSESFRDLDPAGKLKPALTAGYDFSEGTLA